MDQIEIQPLGRSRTWNVWFFLVLSESEQKEYKSNALEPNVKIKRCERWMREIDLFTVSSLKSLFFLLTKHKVKWNEMPLN